MQDDSCTASAHCTFVAVSGRLRLVEARQRSARDGERDTMRTWREASPTRQLDIPYNGTRMLATKRVPSPRRTPHPAPLRNPPRRAAHGRTDLIVPRESDLPSEVKYRLLHRSRREAQEMARRVLRSE